MTENALSGEIVRVARGWIGTRFHHQGRLKRNAMHPGGCDCLGLLVGVAGELGLEDETGPLAGHDRTDYGHYPDGKLLCGTLGRLMDAVAMEKIMPGDIVAMTIDCETRHLGIISDYHPEALGLIHAYAPARAVIEHRLDDKWKQMIAQAFRLRNYTRIGK